MDGTPPAAKAALHISKRTVAPKFGQKFLTVFEIQPYVQLTRVVTDNSVTVESEPPNERIIRFDEFCIAQPQNRNVQRAQAKGCPETLLTLAQTRLALAQTRLALAQFSLGAL